MKFIVIGLGSMGKRRVRNLLSLGYEDVTAFDVRQDRRREAEELHGIKTVDTIDGLSVFDAVFVSVPPDLHMEFASKAYESRVHAFIEAGMFDEGLRELAENVRNSGLKFYASSTMRFHPSVKKIKQLIDSGSVGRLLNFSYHGGSYVPEWHPWEGLDFYGTKRKTGACKEMVAFELAWINWIVGEPIDAKAFYGKISETEDMDIDDVYAVALKYSNGVLGSFMEDATSRSNSVRRLIVNGEKGQIFWDWNEKAVKLFHGDEKSWTRYPEPSGGAADGYSPLIIEEMYIDEVKAFIEAILNDEPVANSLEDDIKNIACLRLIEKS